MEDMKKAGIRVPGIGHRIKSKARPRPRQAWPDRLLEAGL